MSEYIGSKVNVKCKKHGNVSGFVDDVSDDRIILNGASSDLFPGTVLETLALMASDIIDLDLVQTEDKSRSSEQYSSSQAPSEAVTSEAPSTRCAYVCPTTPVRPMRPMRAMKGEEGASSNVALDAKSAVKSQDVQSSKTRQQLPQFKSQQVPQLQKQQVYLKPQPQVQASQSSSKQQSSPFSGHQTNVRHPQAAPKNGSVQTKAHRDRTDANAVGGQMRRRAFSGSGDGGPPHPSASNVRNAGRPGGGGNAGAARKLSRAGRESCFDMDVSQMDEEFDFEGNLAQFNKSEFYKEVDERRQRHEKDKVSPETIPRRPDVVPEPKYRHDENIIPSAMEPVRHPVVLPATWQTGEKKQFSCANGVILPACPVELRRSLFTAAETLCLSWSLIAEMYGRAVSELILDQVGGRTRLRPGNEHQLPHVVVIAGNHMQGTLGVAVARHLSARRCCVSLVIPQMRIGQMEPPKELMDQVELFKNLTGLEVLSSLESCTSKAMDFVVSAIESHEESKNELLLFQPWISNIITFCNTNRPPCLVVDPPPDKGFIRPRLMVGLGLPLSIKLSEQSKAAYFLCDVGLTANVYQRVGISYASPFTYRSILQLTDLDDEEEKHR